MKDMAKMMSMGYAEKMLHGYKLQEPNDDEEFLALGKNNLLGLVQRHEAELQRTDECLRKVRVAMSVLEHCEGVQDMQKLVVIPEGGILPPVAVVSQKYGDLVPRPREAKRPNGSTTFYYCGWCDYACAEMMYGNCKIVSSCDLICMQSMHHELNTLCRFREMSSENWQRNLEEFKTCERKLRRKMETIRKVSKHLRGLALNAEDKPLFTPFRSEDDFKICDAVICVLPDEEAIIASERGNIVAGRILAPAVNGCVLVQMSRPVRESGEALTVGLNGFDTAGLLAVTECVSLDFALGGDIVALPVCSSRLIPKSDFEYLAKHEDYRQNWLRASCQNALEVDSIEISFRYFNPTSA